MTPIPALLYFILLCLLLWVISPSDGAGEG